MDICISDIINDSIVDGKGMRLTVFTQGCPHNCKGCHNPQTHDFNGGKIVDTDSIIKIAIENPLLDGITLSGGEPFMQPEACLDIAIKAKKHGLNIWTYTGFTFEEIINSNDNKKIELLKNTDILVDGKFIEEQRSLDILFCGSRNQRIIDIKKTFENNTIIIKKFDY